MRKLLGYLTCNIKQDNFGVYDISWENSPGNGNKNFELEWKGQTYNGKNKKRKRKKFWLMKYIWTQRNNSNGI